MFGHPDTCVSNCFQYVMSTPSSTCFLDDGNPAGDSFRVGNDSMLRVGLFGVAGAPSKALLLRRIAEGTSFGGLGPRRMALRTGAYASSLPASTERSMSPPRLISPRPTNSIGKSRRSWKI